MPPRKIVLYAKLIKIFFWYWGEKISDIKRSNSFHSWFIWVASRNSRATYQLEITNSNKLIHRRSQFSIRWVWKIKAYGQLPLFFEPWSVSRTSKSPVCSPKWYWYLAKIFTCKISKYIEHQFFFVFFWRTQVAFVQHKTGSKNFGKIEPKYLNILA